MTAISTISACPAARPISPSSPSILRSMTSSISALLSPSCAPRPWSHGSSASMGRIRHGEASTRQSILRRDGCAGRAAHDASMTVVLSFRESCMPFSAAPRSQCRSRRHPSQRAGRAQSRSGARGAAGDRGRRRRHHRAFARGSPPYPRRRHGAAEGRNLEAAEFRDGGDRGHAADCACDQAARGVPRARAPRGTHHRGRPRRGRPAQRAWRRSSRG